MSVRLILTPDGQIEVLRWNVNADRAEGSILLLHGIQGTADVWSPVAEQLPDGRLICAPNMWGRANSSSPRNEHAFTLESFAGIVHTVFATLPKPVTIIGWSMGVLVTLAYFEGFGDQDVDSVVLASGTPCVANEAVWFKGISLTEIEAEAKARAQRLALVAYASPAAVAGAWMSVRQADFRSLLAGITRPTLVLHGDRDEECPLSHAREMAGAIPGARLDVWADHGHNLMVEDAARFARTIKELSGSRQPDALSTNQ